MHGIESIGQAIIKKILLIEHWYTVLYVFHRRFISLGSKRVTVRLFILYQYFLLSFLFFSFFYSSSNNNSLGKIRRTLRKEEQRHFYKTRKLPMVVWYHSLISENPCSSLHKTFLNRFFRIISCFSFYLQNTRLLADFLIIKNV